VSAFYSHSGRHANPSFSNFFKHEPFDFELPDCCWSQHGPELGIPKVVSVDFTEKAIMLCKAAIFGDAQRFQLMVQATEPRKVKGLGRKVTRFDPEVWDANVLEIARTVCVQKFSKVPGLAATLVATGGRVICESTRNDKNWGTGLDIDEPGFDKPWMWKGTNVLGWALMEAREVLAGASSATGSTAADSDHGAPPAGGASGADSRSKPAKGSWGTGDKNSKRRREVGGHLG